MVKLLCLNLRTYFCLMEGKSLIYWGLLGSVKQTELFKSLLKWFYHVLKHENYNLYNLVGEANHVFTKVYYRSCLFDCDLIKPGFDIGASSLIPAGVLDNAVLDVCDSCTETKCNSKNYDQNSIEALRAIFLPVISLLIVSILV